MLTLVIYPIRFGDDILGMLEVEHHKRHAYGSKDMLALSTLAFVWTRWMASPAAERNPGGKEAAPDRTPRPETHAVGYP